MDKKIAIQIRHGENFEQTMKFATESGFKYVSIGFGDAKIFHQDDWEKEVGNIGEILAKNNLSCVMTHAPSYDLLIPAEQIDEDMERAMLRCMKATLMLGGKISAVHPRSVFRGGSPYAEKELPFEQGVDPDKSFVCNMKSFAPLAEEIGKGGGMLGIENLMQYPHWRVPFYGCFTEDHIRMVDEFHSDSVCAVWDFGHSNLMKYDKAEAIRMLGKRIKGTHIHNNFENDDYHLPPSMGKVDWKKVIGALKEQDYDGYLTLEINYPSFALRSYIQHLYECVAELWDFLTGIK